MYFSGSCDVEVGSVQDDVVLPDIKYCNGVPIEDSWKGASTKKKTKDIEFNKNLYSTGKLDVFLNMHCAKHVCVRGQLLINSHFLLSIILLKERAAKPAKNKVFKYTATSKFY